MKLIARLLVMTLVATGAVASTQIAGATQPNVSAKVSAMPVPMCPPGDPTQCGLHPIGSFTQQ